MSSPQKISQLTTAGPLTGAELVPIVQNGGTLQTTVNDFVALANISISPVVSALQTQLDQVSAVAAANTTAITSVQADVSALTIRVASVSAVTSVNSAAITSINNTVSALDVRVSVLEVAVSNIGDVSAIATLVSAVASLEGTVSALVVRVAGVSASVSALQVQLDAVSALTSVNAAAITSINNTVSALEIRVSSASTTGVNNSAAITSVNAVVSLKVFRDNDFMTNVQYIDFNTTTSYAPSAGRLTWDLTHGTLDLGLTGTVNLLIGQRTVAQIYNNSGVTLPKGKAVKVTGASGQRLTGALAQADSDSDSATIFGLMLETVSNLGTGYVATDGVVTNVDTAAYSDGAIVYLSPVSAGELTPTKPVAPQHLVQMGYIVKGGSVGAGSIYVKVQNGYELGELHNVKTSAEASIANGEVLAWNTSASVWTNSTALLDTQASVSALNIQVAAVSASVSALQIQINAVSTALTSTNNAVSALEVRVSAVSAAVVSANAVIAAVSALTSVNAVAIAAVSALVSANTVAIAAVSASVSALQVQVNTVSAAVSAAFVSIGQRVLKAGDTMSGELIMADNLVTRPKFKDYAITAVIRGNVSATATLDMLDGNYFMVTAAGSTTFVFANPPVSAANGGAAGGFILELANGGAATVTWPSATKWPSGTAPTLTSSGTDVFVFITDDGGTIWRGVQSMKDSK